MALGPEGKVKEAVKRLLKDKGIFYYMPVQNGMGQVGIPDFICCWRGRFLAIETKAPGKRANTSANQERVIEAIWSADGWAIVVDDVEQVKDFFTEIESDKQYSEARFAAADCPGNDDSQTPARNASL